jgi:arylsulfatase A-like enzyme
LLLYGEAKAHSAELKAGTTAKRPNIVIILADDMGYSDMGMFGSELCVMFKHQNSNIE